MTPATKHALNQLNEALFELGFELGTVDAVVDQTTPTRKAAIVGEMEKLRVELVAELRKDEATEATAVGHTSSMTYRNGKVTLPL